MPDRARVDAFVAAVVSGDHVRAIADFYHQDATMQEPDREPRRGRHVLMQHEQRALDRIARMHTHAPAAVLVDGDLVVVQWIFDAIGHDGSVRRLEELAIQRWVGDRIAEERFFYDTASAWRRPPAAG
jgi:ketosteroid isomerase-like protein